MECPQCGQDNDPGLRYCVACGASLTGAAEAAAAPADSLLAPGTILKSTYEIIRLLGEGGAGCVYEGRHVALGHAVAIKVLFSQLARIRQIQERFIEEGRIQANLRHPNVVSVTDIVDDGQVVAIVMEYIRGETLHDYIQRQKEPVDLLRGAQIVLRLLAGLGAAHARKIVHRDIKPGNVLLARTERGMVPKLCDFGIAKVASSQSRTVTGTKMGTLHYMAPEQFQDARRVDRRADIYSLGVTFYELVTGRLPFETDNDYQLMRAHVEVKPPSPRGFRPDVSPELEAVILKTLEKRPEERFVSCEEMFQTLVELPGFESLKGAASLPGVPISEEPLPPPEYTPPARPEQIGRRAVATRSVAGSTPRERPKSAARVGTAAGVRPIPKKRPFPWFPIFIGAFAALLAGLVLFWWLTQGQRSAGVVAAQGDAGSPGDIASAVGTGETVGSGDDVEEVQVAATGTDGPLTEAYCDALAEEVASVDALEGLEQPQSEALLARLEQADGCREVMLAASGDDPFSLIYAQIQADRLTIARHLLQALGTTDLAEACRHVLPANRVYERSLSRIQQVIERGELRPFEVETIRELGESLFGGQNRVQTRYYQCR